MGGPLSALRPALLAGAAAVVVAAMAAIAGSVGSRLVWSADPADAPYNLLVRGFREGRLSLAREVPPGLAGLADPYDPAANERYREYPYNLHDLSYYRGRLHLYFGVTPALVLFWPWAAATGRYLPQAAATAGFCAAGFLATAALLLSLRRRFFPGTGTGVAAACLLALGLANGIPVLLQWSNAYEVAVACGYAMAMLSLACVHGALARPSRAGAWLAAASILYGLAVGARPSLLFGAAILAVPVALGWGGGPGRAPRPATLLLCAAGPLFLILCGLMAYNALRFGNPLEFGQHYQLLVGSYRGAAPTFSPRYLGFNLRAYFLEPMRIIGRFPFVADAAAGPIPAGHGAVESPFGILADVPLAWLALAAPLACARRDSGDRRALGGLIAAAGLLFAAGALTVGCYWWTSARYEVDFLPALVLLALLGILGLERALAGRRGSLWAARCAWGTLLALSVAFNLLASFEQRARQYSNHGEMMLTLGRFPEAVADFTEVLRIDPDAADAERSLGFALVAAGRQPDAAAHFDRALRLGGGRGGRGPSVLHSFEDGEMMLSAGRYPEAIAAFGEALRLNPGYLEARLELADAHDRAGRTGEAIADLREALRREPGSADAENLLGLCLGRTGARDEAISHFGRALELRPGFADAENNLGFALAAAGRYAAAEGHFRRATGLRPGFVEAWANLGFVLAATGRRGEAIEAYRRAVAITPGYAAAADGLKRLGAAP